MICTSVNDPGDPAQLQVPKYELHAHVILALTIDNKDNAVTTILKNSNILTYELRTQDISLFLLEAGQKGHLDDIVRSVSELASRLS